MYIVGMNLYKWPAFYHPSTNELSNATKFHWSHTELYNKFIMGVEEESKLHPTAGMKLLW